MSQFFLLRLKVFKVLGVRRHLDMDSLYYFKPVALKTDYLLRIIGNKAYFFEAEIYKYLRAGAIIPQVGFKSKRFVRFDRIQPLILKSICLYLVFETYPTAFLPHVKKYAAAFFPYHGQRLSELSSARSEEHTSELQS